MLGAPTRFIEALTLGLWETNCYLLGDTEQGGCMVVDPGQGGGPAIRARLAERGVRCEAILLTHGHLDHVWSAPELAEDLDVPVLLHTDDRWLWDDPGAGFGSLAPGTLEAQFGIDWRPDSERLSPLRDGMTLRFAGIGLTVRHTPGHTPGSCVFVGTDTADDDPLLLTGDLVFAGSVGRTDFPRGSWRDLMESIARVVLPLEDRTLVLSGHGDATTVGAERRANPFLREIVG